MFVFGIGNELLVAAIDDPIEIFQRNLSDDVRQGVGNFNSIEAAGVLEFPEKLEQRLFAAPNGQTWCEI